MLVTHVDYARNEVELAMLAQAAHDELNPGQMTFEYEPVLRMVTGVLRVDVRRSSPAMARP